VSELMLARGIEVSHEAIRLWTPKVNDAVVHDVYLRVNETDWQTLKASPRFCASMVRFVPWRWRTP
jgi:hypothetical protein